MSATPPDLEARVCVLERRSERSEQDMAAYQDTIVETHEAVRTLVVGVEALKRDMSETKPIVLDTQRRTQRLEQDATVLKQDVTVLRHDIGAFRHEVCDEFAMVRSDVSDLKRGIDAIVACLGIATPEGEN